MKRPFGVTLLGVLLLLQGLLLALAGILMLTLTLSQVAAVLPPALASQLGALTGGQVLLAVVDSVLGGVSVVTGIGMLRLRSWAWFVAMTLQGVTLATLLSDAFLGRENPVNMLLAAVIVFYLNTHSVRQVFHVGQQWSQLVVPGSSGTPGTLGTPWPEGRSPPTMERSAGSAQTSAPTSS